MKKLFVLLGFFMLIIETSLFAAHPIGLVPPIEYFAEEDRSTFLLLVLLTFGTGYPLIAFIAGSREWSKKHLAILLLLGLADKLLINSSSFLLALALALFIASYIHHYRQVIGAGLLATGLLLVAGPLFILYYGSETYMDVEQYQSTIALFQSNHYMEYITYHIHHFIGVDSLIMLFVLLPSVLLSSTIIDWIQKNRVWKFVVLSGLLLLGVMMKSLVVTTSSAITFHLFVTIGGWLIAAALFMLLTPIVSTILSIGIAISVANCSILLTYTDLGFGHYKSLTLQQIQIRDVIILMIAAIVFYVVENFSNRKHIKA